MISSKYISDYVFPAYERMTEELEQLKGSGKNEKGLVFFKIFFRLSYKRQIYFHIFLIIKTIF